MFTAFSVHVLGTNDDKAGEQTTARELTSLTVSNMLEVNDDEENGVNEKSGYFTDGAPRLAYAILSRASCYCSQLITQVQLVMLSQMISLLFFSPVLIIRKVDEALRL